MKEWNKDEVERNGGRSELEKRLKKGLKEWIKKKRLKEGIKGVKWERGSKKGLKGWNKKEVEGKDRRKELRKRLKRRGKPLKRKGCRLNEKGKLKYKLKDKIVSW